MPNSSDINDATAALIARVLSGEAGAEECARLEELAVSDPAVAKAYAEAEATDLKVRREIGTVPEPPSQIPPVPAGLTSRGLGENPAQPEPGSEDSGKVTRFPSWAIGRPGLAAAAAVVLLGAGVFLMMRRDPVDGGVAGGQGGPKLPAPPEVEQADGSLAVETGTATLRREGREFRADPGSSAQLLHGDQVDVPSGGRAAVWDGYLVASAVIGPSSYPFRHEPPEHIKHFGSGLQEALAARANALSDSIPLMTTRSIRDAVTVRSPGRVTHTLTPIIDWSAPADGPCVVIVQDWDDPDKPIVDQFGNKKSPVRFDRDGLSLKAETRYRLLIRGPVKGDTTVSYFSTGREADLFKWPSDDVPAVNRIAQAARLLQSTSPDVPYSDALMLLEGLPESLRNTQPVLRMIALCAGRLGLRETYDAAIEQLQEVGK